MYIVQHILHFSQAVKSNQFNHIFPQQRWWLVGLGMSSKRRASLLAARKRKRKRKKRSCSCSCIVLIIKPMRGKKSNKLICRRMMIIKRRNTRILDLRKFFIQLVILRSKWGNNCCTRLVDNPYAWISAHTRRSCYSSRG